MVGLLSGAVCDTMTTPLPPARRPSAGGRPESASGTGGVRPENIGVAGGSAVVLDMSLREGVEAHRGRGGEVESAADAFAIGAAAQALAALGGVVVHGGAVQTDGAASRINPTPQA